ncbi:MAG: tetraacyldisaccharide 4'-kinase [Beggiatoa sp. IS2]|nr:MAG: tetraacyldisaccharide 4'-kinase [Beggiatoa sp. IS2]
MLIDEIWYGNHPFSLLLAPLGGMFCTMARIRRMVYQYRLLKSQRLAVPVIIVGNLTVGGTGKTPLVIWLGRFLRQQGYQPGIISRGYGGKAQQWPQPVTPTSDPNLVGDEPILLARQSGCPVAVAPKRGVAAQFLLEQYSCNIIISDDGLQHYALQRDIEIAVVDDIRRYGNQRCLPAGPLREPLSRLKQIDLVVTKGAALKHEYSMRYDIKALRKVSDDSVVMQPLSRLRGMKVHVVAGIGHPTKFFNRLKDQGLKLHFHEFPDHHCYTATDLQFNDDHPVIMTEKDAVKCQSFARDHHWYLPIEANLPTPFGERLLRLLKERKLHGKKAT